ncbi:fluoride efflux transporter CrcB [Streptomyces sp. NPDC101733]|uniref:fluoride efflux transporter CrcB n=1 Tax=unclassified Streptomyces TaxID=2593676 RepID=UPI003817BA28
MSGAPAGEGRVLAAVAAGGVVGGSARYAVGLLWPAGGPAAFPWATFWINIWGCALIGVLMVLVAEGGRRAHPLVRPFVGVGVLGGFTTFSTYALDVSRLLDEDEAGRALVYAALTVVGAMGAVWAAAVLTRHAVRGRT